MQKKVFVTGKAMICAIGETTGEIVEAVRNSRIRLQQIPFSLVGLPYTRPYYLILRNERDRPDNRTVGYFSEILFSTIARSIGDADLSTSDLGNTHLFFGSTSMDVPVFEGFIVRTANRYPRVFSAPLTATVKSRRPSGSASRSAGLIIPSQRRAPQAPMRCFTRR